MIIVPNLGKQALLGYLLGRTPVPSSVTYHWFGNDYIPVDTTVASDMVEVSGSVLPGFAVANADWVLSIAGNTAVAIAPTQTLSASGPVTLWGYYVTPTATPSLCLWAERFTPTSIPVPSGGTFRFMPFFSCFSCLPGYFTRPYFG